MKLPATRLDASVRSVLRAIALLLIGAIPAMTGCTGFFVPICQEYNDCTTTTATTSTATTATTASASGSLPQPLIYVANANAENVQGFSLAAGSLIPATSPLSTTTNGGTADAVTAIPNGNLLFLATAEGSIFVDTIAKDGAAQAGNNGRPVASVANPALISTDRTGKLLLAVSSGSPALQIFQIDASNGTLRPTAQGAIPLDSGNPTQLYVAPNDQYIFVTLGSGGVDGFALNAKDGTVDNQFHIVPLQAGSQDNAIASDGNSNDLFVGEKDSGIRVLTIGPSEALTEISGSPFAAQNGGPSSLVVDPADSELYAAYPGANNLAAYRIGQSGALTLTTNTQFSAAPSPTALSIDATGTHLLALSNTGSLQVFNVGSETAAGK